MDFLKFNLKFKVISIVPSRKRFILKQVSNSIYNKFYVADFSKHVKLDEIQTDDLLVRTSFFGATQLKKFHEYKNKRTGKEYSIILRSEHYTHLGAHKGTYNYENYA